MFVPSSRYGQDMRILMALMVVAAMSGCAEVVQGPREVAYSDDSFYIRHSPFAGVASVDARAQDRCKAIGKAAALKREAQYYVVDLRDATYACQ
ncbi:hypothetical protein DF3PA_320010 [Candidatus Defluviicoccus seviourii]|uniref:Lipoprotein n=2 Tax=root TaxID=1 RepID=A0A564WG93_9PROT|nr:hypothetical protein DF3PB_1290002 [uncultured Defluviicoccus sp.]SUS08001.1 hypothetical protein DF3PB_5520002 [uncultured Defluviicoccus sp.]VUX47018.1 hypothetical protein DF3PA_320010 [Candidatus Defluviicoccus seviourii]